MYKHVIEYTEGHLGTLLCKVRSKESVCTLLLKRLLTKPVQRVVGKTDDVELSISKKSNQPSGKHATKVKVHL